MSGKINHEGAGGGKFEQSGVRVELRVDVGIELFRGAERGHLFLVLLYLINGIKLKLRINITIKNIPITLKN